MARGPKKGPKPTLFSLPSGPVLRIVHARAVHELARVRARDLAPSLRRGLARSSAQMAALKMSTCFEGSFTLPDLAASEGSQRV